MTGGPDPDRDAQLERIGDAPLTLVIGDTDTGKTSFVRDLANRWFARGRSVALVDADVGQSEVGVPTAIGLGAVRRVLSRPADADQLALRFVGATSAAREPLATVVGTKHLADRAFRQGFDHVVVDTSGLVRGELGQRLKQAKIELLAPDVLVALQRNGECEPILRPYGRPRPLVVRVPAVIPLRRRTPDDRRRHRERRLAAHFAGARPVALDLSRVVLKAPALFAGPPLAADEMTAAADLLGEELLWGERRGGEVAVITRAVLDETTARALARRLRASGLVRRALGDLVGMLAGLDDEDHDTLALGIVTALDLAGGRITVESGVDPARVASVAIGHERYRAAVAIDPLRGHEDASREA